MRRFGGDWLQSASIGRLRARPEKQKARLAGLFALNTWLRG
jgi:hypothetical protein